jgi:hypothetical protein
MPRSFETRQEDCKIPGVGFHTFSGVRGLAPALSGPRLVIEGGGKPHALQFAFDRFDTSGLCNPPAKLDWRNHDFSLALHSRRKSLGDFLLWNGE